MHPACTQTIPSEDNGNTGFENTTLPCIAMAVIECKTNKLNLTKSFSGPILATFCSETLDLCGVTRAYIITNFMTKLQRLDNNALQLHDGFEDNQSEDKDSNFNNNILDLDRINGIPAGEPSAIKDGLSNIDEEMPESHYSESDQEDTILSTANKNQLRRKLIAQTDGLFIGQVEIVSNMLKESKKKLAAARKIELQVKLEKEVIQSTKV